MITRLFVGLMLCGFVLGMAFAGKRQVQAGESSYSGYKVLSPIRHGNLTVFPVVANTSHNTQLFLTLDEGLRSGEVIVTEAGAIRPMVRRRSDRMAPIHEGAQVNQLMLINNSSRPLLLLAGEIVSGGKQDRVIGKDRIVPAESDPIDLSVFCVEPGRWVGTSSKFYSTGGMASAMAAPGVRSKAMADKDQQKVWSEVRNSQATIMARVPMASPTGAGQGEAAQLESTTSYAKLMDNKVVQKQVDSVAAPMESDYRSVIKQLRESKCCRRGGRRKWRDHLGRHLRQHRSAAEVLAEAGAFLRCGVHRFACEWEEGGRGCSPGFSGKDGRPTRKRG